MTDDDQTNYDLIRSGRAGFYEQNRGLIAVWGKEAVPFLDGMITNDMKTLEDGSQMRAAFPNAQGRLLAVVRIRRQDDKFFIETEDATRESLFQNLFRFTLAGDFFVEDLSDKYRYFQFFISDAKFEISNSAPQIRFEGEAGPGVFGEIGSADEFKAGLDASGALEMGDELYETLRIESGISLFGVDMDETTIVSELGIDGLISYSKGCYIGQEIIARIHFRGHVAKRLTGLVSDGRIDAGAELTSSEGKPAGKVTSAAYSPKLQEHVALAFVRFDFLAEETNLFVNGKLVIVTALPFV